VPRINVKPNPITKKSKTGLVTRILRPKEYKLIEAEILKLHHRVMLQALLFTGMRYIELKRLQQNPKWFDGEFINIVVGEGVKKHKIRMNERYVRLNPLGKMAIMNFIGLKEELPTNQTWRENMIRWAESANIESIGLCPKTTRKTWESWLMFYYPDKALQILMSQGHTGAISLKHYLNMPFTDQDKRDMEQYVGNWI